MADLNFAELRILRRDRDVAHARDLDALAHCVASHGGDDRLRQVPESLHEVHGPGRVDAVVRSWRGLQVAPGAEGAARAAQDHGADSVVALDRIDRAAKAALERPVDGVEDERSVERDPGDAVLDLVEHIVLRRRWHLEALGCVAAVGVAIRLGDGHGLGVDGLVHRGTSRHTAAVGCGVAAS